MKISKEGALAVVAFALLLSAFAPAANAEGGSLVSGLSPAKGPNDIGVIFNTNDILLGLGEYQGGLGAKIGWDKFALRGMFDFTINGSASAFAVGLGLTGEYHFIQSPVSPYLGLSVGAGYLAQSNVSTSVSFSVGPVVGVEVFMFDFLSLFAEYTITANFTSTTDSQTSQSTLDYLITTGMGNSAKLGIVIYFMRSEAKSK